MLLNDTQFASVAAVILSGQAVKAEATSPCFTTHAVKCFLALAHFSQWEDLDRTNICLYERCQNLDSKLNRVNPCVLNCTFLSLTGVSVVFIY